MLETSASHRLFGGRQAMLERLVYESCPWRDAALACAPSAMAALALARAAKQDRIESQAPRHWVDGVRDDMSPTLDPLPLKVIRAVADHETTLSRLGCQTLGDVRRLPRGGLVRRFGAAMLQALDQAYGDAPEVHVWLSCPEQFELHVLLPHRLDTAQAIGGACAEMLQNLCLWLGARQAGVRQLTLSWHFDRHKQDLDGARQCVLKLAEPARDHALLHRLLDEHLRHLVLPAPVDELWLRADEVAPLAPLSDSLFAQTGVDPLSERQQREAMQTLLARLRVRLSSGAVQQVQICADHRPEKTQSWRNIDHLSRSQAIGSNHSEPLPQPGWLLPSPIPLSLSREAHGPKEHPSYHGALQLLAGPQRIESGWWGDSEADMVVRDYYIARSPQAGLLWVFRVRGPQALQDSPWFLHGFFA